MKTISLLLSLCLAGVSSAFASAPSDIAGGTFIISISSGSGVFAEAGRYWVRLYADGSYILRGDGVNVIDSAGTYTYEKTGAHSGTLTVQDSEVGVAVAQTLSFDSATTGTFAISSTAGNQSGTMQVYVPETLPFDLSGWTWNDQYPWVFSLDHGWIYCFSSNEGIWAHHQATDQWVLIN